MSLTFFPIVVRIFCFLSRTGTKYHWIKEVCINQSTSKRFLISCLEQQNLQCIIFLTYAKLEEFRGKNFACLLSNEHRNSIFKVSLMVQCIGLFSHCNFWVPDLDCPEMFFIKKLVKSTFKYMVHFPPWQSYRLASYSLPRTWKWCPAAPHCLPTIRLYS